jgi:hypothetical protein
MKKNTISTLLFNQIPRSMHTHPKEKKEKIFPQVFIDISVAKKPHGRIIFELFSDCPLTSENFRCLCTGEKGNGKSG